MDIQQIRFLSKQWNNQSKLNNANSATALSQRDTAKTVKPSALFILFIYVSIVNMNQQMATIGYF